MASKANKARKHAEKMKQKRAEKAARKSKYMAMTGTSKKKKRQGKVSMVSGTYKHAHVMANCGNLGCRKCYPYIGGSAWTIKGLSEYQ